MSFGFSVGDFVAVGGLITQVVSALCEAGGSASQYRHIIDKLRIVDQAIRDVNRLHPVEGLEADLEATKTTALSCQLPLLDYLETIRKYDKSLGPGHAMGVRLKIQWLVTKKLEAAMKLEAEIVAYLGVINLRLGIYKLRADTLTEQRTRRRFESTLANQHIQMQTIVAQVEQDTRNVRKDIKESSKETAQALMSLQQSCFASVSEFLKTAGTLSKVTLETLSKVCEIYNTVLWIRSRLSEPDTRHTWFQEPMRWEDAYGWVIPIPAEFDYPMMEGALRGHFREGRGKKLVERNQWQLFDPSSPRIVFSVENWEPFPGMKITMAMIIPQYDDQMVCPQLTCSSKSYTDAPGGGKICSGCNAWFDSLLKSSSPPKITEIIDSEQYTGVSSKTKTAKLPSKIDKAAKSGLQARDEDNGSDTESEIDEEDLRHLKNARVRLEGARMCIACDFTCPTLAALRKHITSEHGAAGTYICIFGFAGCASTFASKNEWKRHVISQHLELRYWRCEIGSCSGTHHSDFNRKNHFTQHLHQMHSPSVSAEWNAEVLELQAAAVRVRRLPPPLMRCPVRNCKALFEGNNVWDQCMEHLGRHLEGVAAGAEEGGWCQGEDSMLLAWARRRGIIWKNGVIWVLNDGRPPFIVEEDDSEGGNEYDSGDGDEYNSGDRDEYNSGDGDENYAGYLLSLAAEESEQQMQVEELKWRERKLEEMGASGEMGRERENKMDIKWRLEMERRERKRVIGFYHDGDESDSDEGDSTNRNQSRFEWKPSRKSDEKISSENADIDDVVVTERTQKQYLLNGTAAHYIQTATRKAQASDLEGPTTIYGKYSDLQDTKMSDHGESNYEVFDPLNWMLDGLIDFPFSPSLAVQMD